MYFTLSLLGVIGKKQTVPQAAIKTNEATAQEFTGEIDETTLNEVEKLNDYGEASLDNIGRPNPFGSL